MPRSAPVLHMTVNAATNRFTGVSFGYDANGNLTYAGSVDANYTYDIDNRMITQRNTTTLTSELYSYGPDNLRVWRRKANGTEEVTLYGLRGERLGTLQPSFTNHDVLTGSSSNLLYFAGRPLSYGADRLGSKRADSPNAQGQTISYNYFPYGEEYSTTTEDTEKFGTYYRDSTTALDYARNRVYSNRLARFLTADPYRNSAGPTDPGSWNRYAYVGNDPVNFNDPQELFMSSAGDGEPADNFCTVRPDYWLCRSDFYNPVFLFKNGFGFLLGGGGGGDGGPNQGILQVTNVQKSGRDYNQGENRNIENVLDPDCLSFLQSGGGVLESYVGDLLSNNLLAVASFTTKIAAFNSSAATTLPPGTAPITVNGTGAFFSNRFTVDQGNLMGGTARAQVFILLHELAHALGAQGFQPDLNNSRAGKANDKLIDTNCKKTLSEFRSQ